MKGTAGGRRRNSIRPSVLQMFAASISAGMLSLGLLAMADSLGPEGALINSSFLTSGQELPSNIAITVAGAAALEPRSDTWSF